jgi:hypothetical protein
MINGFPLSFFSFSSSEESSIGYTSSDPNWNYFIKADFRSEAFVAFCILRDFSTFESNVCKNSHKAFNSTYLF